jgi:hypothetical protein
LLPPFPGRFTKSDWLALATNTYQLTFPILRRRAFQRHCFFDSTTFGLWRLIGQLLNQGAIRLIPQPLYKHAETTGRLEQQSHEPWYHDFIRSDWELYIASIGRLDAAMMGQFVAVRTAPTYVAGQEYAQKLDLPLLERTFLMRHLAYDEGPEATATAAMRAEAWENTRRIAAVAVQLTDRLAADTDLRRLIVERGRMNIVGMLGDLGEKIPGVAIIELEIEQLLAFEGQPGGLVLTEYWESLATLGKRPHGDPIRHVAVGDIIGRLRPRVGRPPSILRGPKGTHHFSMV